MKRIFRLSLALPEDVAAFLQGYAGERQISETLRKALEVFLADPKPPIAPLPFRENFSVITSVVLDRDQYERVKKIAIEWNTSRVAVIRYALRRYMWQMNGNEKREIQ